MKVKMLVGEDCDGGSSNGGCPAVYETDRNSFVMQGKFLPEGVLGQLNLSADETAVELPSELIAQFIARMK